MLLSNFVILYRQAFRLYVCWRGRGVGGGGKGGWGIVFYKQISSSTGVYSVNVICTVRIHVAWLHAMSFIFLN